MKKEIIAIVVLVLAIVLLISVIDFYKKNVEQADAKKFVIEELKNKYPLADVEIIMVTEKVANDSSKYYEIKAKVTKDLASPCPERMHIYFDYPEQNFVSQPPEYITKDCKVCLEKQNCPILFQEEAIIASHTLDGTENVQEFITGNKGVYPAVNENQNSWTVYWDSPLTSYYYQIEISKNASMLKVEKKYKNE